MCNTEREFPTHASYLCSINEPKFFKCAESISLLTLKRGISDSVAASVFHYSTVFLQGELLCTRLRCPSANYSYTDYQLNSNDTLQNATKADVNEGRMRGKDPCMECDYEPISPVCGLNWKTYRSMCHALYCGGLKIEQVKQGTCEVMVSIKKRPLF